MPQRLTPPLEPMLAKPLPAIPPGMAYEPKWDGFRCLVFREGDDVRLWSRSGRDLTGYFPELVAGLLDNIPPRCILDGEIIVIVGERMDFVRLTERIHPAASRIQRLAAEIPASFIAWDVVGLDSDDLTAQPLSERRRLLEAALAHAEAPVYLSPQTLDESVARVWFEQFEGAGLDGVMAKPLDAPYRFGERTMFKVKHKREADCVVGGFKLHKNASPERPLLGSLQLGLYDEAGEFCWVGVCSAFPDKVRAELGSMLGELEVPADSADWHAHPWSTPQQPGGPRRPGTQSRWTKEKKEFHLISPMLVVAVNYEHMEGTRFRHTTQFLRWRPDRDPASCTFAQLEEPVRYDLATLLGGA